MIYGYALWVKIRYCTSIPKIGWWHKKKLRWLLAKVRPQHKLAAAPQWVFRGLKNAASHVHGKRHGMAWPHGVHWWNRKRNLKIWNPIFHRLRRWRKSMSLSEWLPKMMAHKGGLVLRAMQPNQLSPATWSVCSGSQHGYGFFWLTSNPNGKHYIRIQHISSQKVNFQLGTPHPPPFEPPSLPSLPNLVRFPPPIHPAPTVENVTWRWSPVLVSPKMLGFPDFHYKLMKVWSGGSSIASLEYCSRCSLHFFWPSSLDFPDWTSVAALCQHCLTIKSHRTLYPYQKSSKLLQAFVSLCS